MCLACVSPLPEMAGGTLSPTAQGQCCRDWGPPSPFSSLWLHSTPPSPTQLLHSGKVQFVNFTLKVWDAGFGGKGGGQHLRITCSVL